jgi:hypothetical protein
MTKTRQVLILSIILVSTLSAIPAGIQISRMGDFLAGEHPNMPDDTGLPSFSNVRVLCVGSRNDLLVNVLNAANSSGATLIFHPDIPDLRGAEFALNNTPMIAVVFDGDWIQSKAGNTSLGDFLRNASTGGILLAAIGGSTSSLFEQLNQSGIIAFKSGRNPAESDPACVAFRRSGEVDLAYLCNSLSVPDITRILANSASDPHATGGPVYLRGLGNTNLTLAKSFQYAPLLASPPHGKLGVSVDIYKLQKDGTPAYDWYYFFVTLRSQAGHQVYGSDWLTADFDASLVAVDPNGGVWHPGDTTGLYHYGPSTAYGTSEVDFTVGQVQWRYDILDVEVLDHSDFSQGKVAWVHNLDEIGFKPSAMYTYQAEPVFVIKTEQDCPVYVDASYYINLGHVQWFLIWPYWEYYRIGSSILYFDAMRTGDS